MTLMKLSKSKDFRRKGQLIISFLYLSFILITQTNQKKYIFNQNKGIKKIDKSLYENIIYNETKFGVEFVNEIHLCNIKEKQQDGFYKTESSIQFINLDEEI